MQKNTTEFTLKDLTMENQNPEVIELQASSRYDSASEKVGSAPKPLTAEEIQAWLSSYLVELLEIEQDEVDIQETFEGYGLDSAVTVSIVGDLERWLKCKLSPNLLYNYPTIEALAQYLADKLKVKAKTN